MASDWCKYTFHNPQGKRERERLIRGLGIISLRVHPMAKKPHTFSPRTISIPKEKYKGLVYEWRLPLRVAETSAVVGPFFWFERYERDGEEYLRK